MPEKEIYELIDKTNNGDLKAEEKLVLHNIRLVLYQVTHRFNLVKYDKKDLVSIGIIGLIKAVKSYDVTKKIQFSTYAIKCIDNEILMSLRKIKKDKNIDSLDRIIECSNNDNDKLKLGDVLTNELDNVEEKLYKAGYEPRQVEGHNTNWVLLDYNDIIVHVFSKEDRLFYDLERIWRDGKVINIDEI